MARIIFGFHGNLKHLLRPGGTKPYLTYLSDMKTITGHLGGTLIKSLSFCTGNNTTSLKRIVHCRGWRSRRPAGTWLQPQQRWRPLHAAGGFKIIFTSHKGILMKRQRKKPELAEWKWENNRRKEKERQTEKVPATSRGFRRRALSHAHMKTFILQHVKQTPDSAKTDPTYQSDQSLCANLKFFVWRQSNSREI